MLSTVLKFLGGLGPAAKIFVAVKVILVAAIVGGTLGGAYMLGQAHIQAEWDAERAAQAATVADVRIQQVRETAEVVVKYVDRVKTVRVQGETIIKEVPVYVTLEDDSRCDVGDGFVSMWNAANQGALPGAAAGADGEAGEPGGDAPGGEADAERGGEAARPGGDPGAGAAGAAALPPRLDEANAAVPGLRLDARSL